MTEDAVMVLVKSYTMDRDTVVASLDQAPTWDHDTITDERIVRVGAKAVALVYRAKAERKGEEPFEAVMISVHVRSADGPRLALYTPRTETYWSDAEREQARAAHIRFRPRGRTKTIPPPSERSGSCSRERAPASGQQ